MSEGLARVRSALTSAEQSSHDAGWTMPSAFYTDPDFHALELEHLFAKDWHCVGRVEEIAQSAQWFPYRLLNEPLVITHGTDGTIRALSNVCRHRGTLIAKEKGKGRRLLCPYHHWAYDLTGQLKAAPKIEERPGFAVKDCRLPSFPCEVWMGFIYVNLDQDAKPFAPQVADLEAMIGPYHMEDMWLGYTGEAVWETNWKSMIENYMEGYYLSPLHKSGLANLNPTDMCEHLEPQENWYGYSVGFPEDLPRVTAGDPGLTKHQSNTCIMAMVHPGNGIGLAADYSSYLCIQPEGTDKVRYKAGILFWGDAWPRSAVDRAVELFHQTMEEDRSVLEPMMIGYKSAHHAPGPIASVPLEGTILDLAKYAARRLGPVIDAST